MQIGIGHRNPDPDNYYKQGDSLDELHNYAVSEILRHNVVGNFKQTLLEDEPWPETAVSGIKGFRIRVRNDWENKDNDYFLITFDGYNNNENKPVIFVIRAIFLTQNHQEEDKIIENLVRSLKPN